MTNPAPPIPPKRCKKCFYVLDHLESRICPECGEPFDPNDPTTYTHKLPYVWWIYWLPIAILVGVGGGVIWLLLVMYAGFTVSTTLVVPMSISAVVGYSGQYKGAFKFYMILLSAGIAIGIAIGILNGAGVGAGVMGGFCSFIFGLILLLPLSVAALIGAVLRRTLANSNFSQRDYLRSIIFLFLVALPVISTLIEGRYPLARPVSISTSAVINAPPMQAWHGIQFFEEVHRPVPWLLWTSPSLRPLYTTGKSESVGDMKTCIYQHGKLVKQVTEVIPGKRLAFRVVEQDHVENDGVILLDGSFDLEPIGDGKQTRVTLTTRYIPRLHPRIAYQWAEAWVVHTLHGHVLAGMSDKAQEKVR